jgi:D-alanine transaminase
MNETVYLNGAFLIREEAKISPDDRGFHFADGVYEVVKYYRGQPFRMEDCKEV